MRIGVLTTSFPRFGGDVAGHFVLGFCRALSARGHQLQVLAPEPAEGAAPDFGDIELQWVPYLRPRSLQRSFYGAGVPDNLRRDPRAWLGLAPFSAALLQASQKAVERWDAIVSHWALPCALVAGAVRGSRPHLAVMHSADVHALDRLPAGGHIARRVAASAGPMVFSSRPLRQQFLAHMDPVKRVQVAARSHVCAMGIDATPPFAGDRRALRQQLGLKGLTVLSMGRLVPIKGIDILLQAATRLPEVQWVVAGDGPARATLERQAPANVRFVGMLRGEQKRSWLAAADAFAIPSLQLPSGRTEGTPTTVLEAMDVGLPVVASQVGGLGELVREGRNGLPVKAGDPLALAGAVERLRDRNLRRRLGRGARRTASEYHWHHLVTHFEDLLESNGFQSETV